MAAAWAAPKLKPRTGICSPLTVTNHYSIPMSIRIPRHNPPTGRDPKWNGSLRFGIVGQAPEHRFLRDTTNYVHTRIEPIPHYIYMLVYITT